MNIETSSGGTEQRADLSSQTASDMRSEWASRLAGVDTRGKALLLTSHIERVSRVLDNYSEQIADRWREGNQGRGQEIPDSEMRGIVTASIEGERPVLQAYEDMIEYAYRQIREADQFEAETMAEMKTMIDHYYELYSLVFFPTGSVSEYEFATGEQQDELLAQIERVRSELQRY